MIATQLVDSLRPGAWAELEPDTRPRVFFNVISVHVDPEFTAVTYRHPEFNEYEDIVRSFAPNAAVKVRTGKRGRKTAVIG